MFHFLVPFGEQKHIAYLTIERNNEPMPAKLVTLGDSLTQGFKSGAIRDTGLSWPTFVATALGVREAEFHKPDFSSGPGLPLDLEALVRRLGERVGNRLDWFDLATAFGVAQFYLDETEDYWERGEGAEAQAMHTFHHNLAVWGFEMADAMGITEASCRRALPKARDHLHTAKQIPEFAMYRTARRTLNPSFGSRYEDLNQLDWVEKIAREQGGIENLVVALGANNCLGTVTSLEIRMSHSADLFKPAHLREANLWDPDHFIRLLDQLVERIDRLQSALPHDSRIGRVVLGTVPHVTIAPVSRGISLGRPEAKPYRDSARKYYEYYTHFWIWDDDFLEDPHAYPHLTREEAAFIDGCIDRYNEAIRARARARDWGLIDVCGLLDSFAFRSTSGRPKYAFPDGLVDALRTNPATEDRVDGNGKVHLDARYFRVQPKARSRAARYEGGLFSLDGIHPTTVCYAIAADEVRKVLENMGAQIEAIDWRRAVHNDTLLTSPPGLLEDLRSFLTFLSRNTPIHQLVRSIGNAFGRS